MSQHVYDLIVTQFSRSLRGMKECLQAARTHAKERSFDENNFLSLRIAPDMFPLSRQVQIATDNAKGAVARLAGKAAPVFEDKETTLEELLQRVEKTMKYVSEFKSTDFKDYETREQRFPFAPGVYLKGKDYFETHALPNFYFHYSAMYMLLRGAGVNLGKKHFMNDQPWIKE